MLHAAMEFSLVLDAHRDLYHRLLQAEKGLDHLLWIEPDLSEIDGNDMRQRLVEGGVNFITNGLAFIDEGCLFLSASLQVEFSDIAVLNLNITKAFLRSAFNHALSFVRLNLKAMESHCEGLLLDLADGADQCLSILTSIESTLPRPEQLHCIAQAYDALHMLSDRKITSYVWPKSQPDFVDWLFDRPDAPVPYAGGKYVKVY